MRKYLFVVLTFQVFLGSQLFAQMVSPAAGEMGSALVLAGEMGSALVLK